MTLREFVSHNFWLKCFSLLLASLVWAAIRFQMGLSSNPGANELPSTYRERAFTALRITVLSDAADTRIFKVTPPQVTVTVSGEASRVVNLTPQDIQVFVNLIDPEGSRAMFQRVNVICPSSLRYRVEPPVVHVELMNKPGASAPGTKP